MTDPKPIETLLAHLRRSLDDDSFVGFDLRPSSGTSATGGERVGVRLIEMKGTPHLSVTTRKFQAVLGSSGRDGDDDGSAGIGPTKPGSRTGEPKPRPTGGVHTRNLPLLEGVAWIREALQSGPANALLRTTSRDWQLHRHRNGSLKLVAHKPSRPGKPTRQHDEPKQTPLGSNARDWLMALGVTNPNGRPKPSMANKHRQICRYSEILAHLARDCGWTGADSPNAPALKLADMGCGKGYLTFAAWQLFHRELHRPVTLLGVENRPHLVEEANRTARRVQAAGLEFVQGDIATVPLTALDGLIALHACNTATDDAIRRGIELGATLIVMAPCCHQAVRPELGDPAPLAPLLRHGLFKERLAEWLTDGLRTLFLEWAGYETKAIEFVGSEHTAKNLMLASIRKKPAFKEAAARDRILALKHFFGIEHHALDPLLQ